MGVSGPHHIGEGLTNGYDFLNEILTSLKGVVEAGLPRANLRSVCPSFRFRLHHFNRVIRFVLVNAPASSR